jgi:hypothetical protein
MPTTIRTQVIQRLLQQVTGGSPENGGAVVFNPGTLLHDAYNSGEFNFSCYGPPCRKFFKKSICRSRPINAICELQFYFTVPVAHEEAYQLIEIVVLEFCAKARAFFANLPSKATKAECHFRYQFSVEQVNQLMLTNHNSIRASVCNNPMRVTNNLLEITDGPRPLAIRDRPPHG